MLSSGKVFSLSACLCYPAILLICTRSQSNFKVQERNSPFQECEDNKRYFSQNLHNVRTVLVRIKKISTLFHSSSQPSFIKQKIYYFQETIDFVDKVNRTSKKLSTILNKTKRNETIRKMITRIRTQLNVTMLCNSSWTKSKLQRNEKFDCACLLLMRSMHVSPHVYAWLLSLDII